jgi:hypothetical protein
MRQEPRHLLERPHAVARRGREQAVVEATAEGVLVDCEVAFLVTVGSARLGIAEEPLLAARDSFLDRWAGPARGIDLGIRLFRLRSTLLGVLRLQLQCWHAQHFLSWR